MAIGRTFQESLQKALRGLETGLTGLDEIEIEGLGRSDDKNAIRAALGTPTPDRILQVAQAMRLGWTNEDIFTSCKIDPWFLAEMRGIVEMESKIRKSGLPAHAFGMRGFGRELRRKVRQEIPYMFTMYAQGEPLPRYDNYVALDPEVKDAWGIPAIRVTYKDHPDDLAFARFLQDRQVEIMHAAGAQKVWRDAVAEQVFGVHLLGTCRMGNDPRASVVDKYHRTHDVRNLFLCDGSSFVTSGRGQPTMTIQALAFRAADHIAQFAKRNEI